jgi:hypothetical protein
MGQTTVDLFRSGRAADAGMERFRIWPHPDPDLDSYIGVSTGDLWVKPHTGGVSTSETIDPIWTGKPWRLVAGSSYGDRLYLNDDGQGHWTWEADVNMTAAEYRRLLADMNQYFVKAWP